MGKVSRQLAGMSLSEAPAAARHNVQIKHSKPEYKIQVEQVTQKKKKLLSMTTYRVQAPPGYTFIPLASHELTDKCKEFSRLDGVQIHVVSTSKGGKNSTELSRQVGRVGHHFPSSIVARALTALGYDIDRSGRILHDLQRMSKGVGNEASRKDQKGTRIGEGITSPTELKKIQEVLNNEARASLATLFPRMPNKDKKEVVKHAFAIGKDRIGSSAELSIDRRVHLAVLAHIRHTYTNYDKLLKEVPYQTARSIVEQGTLQKIIEWRGEGDNDDDVEEILREVIVIDDDDDDDEPISPNQVGVVGDDIEEIQFLTSPIAADKIDSRPFVVIPSPSSRSRLVYAPNNPYPLPDERDRYVRIIDPERQRRNDDQRRHRWQEFKRSYRQAEPIASPIYIPAASGNTTDPMHSLSEIHGSQRRYQESSYWDRSNERTTNVAPKPQMVMLSQPKVGVSHNAVGTYTVDTVRRGPQTSERRTPEYREVVHESIENPASEQKAGLYREVIVLDSPPSVKTRSARPLQNVIVPGDRHKVVSTLEPINTGRAVAANQINAQYPPRKRGFDDLEPLNQHTSQTAYSNKIVHLSSGADHRSRPVLEEDLSRVAPAVHLIPLQRRYSPRRPEPSVREEDAPKRVNDLTHFYQNARASSPHHIYEATPNSLHYDDRVTYVRANPQGRDSHNNDVRHPQGPFSAYDQKALVRQENARRAPYSLYEYDQRRNTVPSIAQYEKQYPANYHPVRSDSYHPAGTLMSNGSNTSYPQYHNQKPIEDGMRQHLQRLHFYEPPRTAMTTAPKRFYDEHGREIIVVERR